MKEKVYKITFAEDEPIICTNDEDACTELNESLADLPVGSKVTIEAIEMTEEEINALPEL